MRNEKQMRHARESNTCYPDLFPLSSDVSCQLLGCLCAKRSGPDASVLFAVELAAPS